MSTLCACRNMIWHDEPACKPHSSEGSVDCEAWMTQLKLVDDASATPELCLSWPTASFCVNRYAYLFSCYWNCRCPFFFFSSLLFQIFVWEAFLVTSAGWLAKSNVQSLELINCLYRRKLRLKREVSGGSHFDTKCSLIIVGWFFFFSVSV